MVYFKVSFCGPYFNFILKKTIMQFLLITERTNLYARKNGFLNLFHFLLIWLLLFIAESIVYLLLDLVRDVYVRCNFIPENFSSWLQFSRLLIYVEKSRCFVNFSIKKPRWKTGIHRSSCIWFITPKVHLLLNNFILDPIVLRNTYHLFNIWSL